MPSTRHTLSAVGAAAATLFAFAFVLVGSEPVLAQSGFTDPRSSLSFAVRLGLRVLAAVVVNLVLGGLLVVFNPTYAERKVDQFEADPQQTVVWGLIVALGVPVALIALAITIVGLVLALPGAFVFAGVALVAAAVTVVLVGSLAGEAPAASGRSLLVGALVVGLLTSIPLVGRLLGWLIGLPGVGLVGHDLYQWVRD